MTLRSLWKFAFFTALTLTTTRSAFADEAPKKEAAPAAGAAAGAEEDDEPVHATASRKGEIKEIGIFITNVGKIDPVKEVWEFDALLTMGGTSHIRKCATKPIQELFPEGVVKKVDEANEYEEQGKQYRQCKVTVEQQATINVARYPFDKHELEITIGDEGDARAGVEFKPTADHEVVGVAPGVKLSGWQFGELTSSQESSVDPHSKQKLTQAKFYLPASRPAVASFIKGFLGVCFQLMIALVALVLAVKAAPNRIGLATGALIATATAHNQISSSIGVSYLTTADKFFFLSYFLLLANVIFSASMIRAEDQKQEDRIKKLYRTAWLVLPALTVIGSALVLSGVV